VNAKIVQLLKPAFAFFLKHALFSLKPLFLSENEKLKNAFQEKGFHLALCTHPSIVFGERREAKGHVGCLTWKVAFLKKCIKIGLLKDEKGHRLLQEIGIQPYYGNGVEFWFEESHSPLKPYCLPEVEKPKGRIAVYSAVTGEYDDVHEILYKEDGVDYFLFTNNPSLRSKTWQVVLVESNLDDMLLSREIKMLPYKYLGEAYDMSIYVDANVVIYGELSNLTKYLAGEKTLAVSRHGERRTVKAEIDACVRLKGVDKKEAEKQYEKYLQEGFQDDQSLLECGLLVRKHKDQKLQHLMQVWFEEYKNGIRRDQLSLLPCINCLLFDGLAVMEGSVWHNQFGRIQKHKNVKTDRDHIH
jgi:hypothetical protein